MTRNTKVWTFSREDAEPQLKVVRDLTDDEQFFAAEKEALLAIADRHDADAERAQADQLTAIELAKQAREKAGKMPEPTLTADAEPAA